MQALSSTYTKVKSLQSELDDLISNDNTEAKELMKDVNKIIEPAYSRKRTDNLFSAAFYLVSIVSSFMSTVLPYSIYKIVLVMVLLIQLIIGSRTMINILKLNYSRKELKNAAHKLLLVGAIAALTISILIIISILSLIIDNDLYVEYISLFILAAFPFSIHLIFGISFFRKEKKKSMIVWLLFAFFSLLITIVFSLLREPIFGIVGICIALFELAYLLVYLLKR